MKKINLVFLLELTMVVSSLVGQSQTPYIIIDPSFDSMYVVNTHDTVLDSGGTGGEHYYKLDLDGNGIPDFTFSALSWMGGQSEYSYIRLSSDDNSTFSADSVITNIGHYDSVGQVYYTQDLVPMVRIYEDLDTLYPDDCSDSIKTDISDYYYVYFPRPCIVISLDYWISGWGPHYIGIRKKINNVDYLGWIKVEVVNRKQIVIKEYALNHKLLDIPQFAFSALTIYPNPVGSTLYIKGSSFEKVEIYDVFGSLVDTVDTNTIGSQVEINVDNLKPGIYLIRIFEKGTIITRKILKI